MGNCFVGTMTDSNAAIKVITSNGGIMEFNAPITVSFITKEFPEHAIFEIFSSAPHISSNTLEIPILPS
jgi:hypothetical protein